MSETKKWCIAGWERNRDGEWVQPGSPPVVLKDPQRKAELDIAEQALDLLSESFMGYSADWPTHTDALLASCLRQPTGGRRHFIEINILPR